MVNDHRQFLHHLPKMQPPPPCCSPCWKPLPTGGRSSPGSAMLQRAAEPPHPKPGEPCASQHSRCEDSADSEQEGLDPKQLPTLIQIASICRVRCCGKASRQLQGLRCSSGPALQTVVTGTDKCLQPEERAPRASLHLSASPKSSFPVLLCF